MTARFDFRGYAWPALVGCLILLIANEIANPTFIYQDNWQSVMLAAAPFILTALAQTAPVLSGNGGLDLSVGPLAGLVSAVIASTLGRNGITDPVSTIAAALGIGVASGLFNGILVAVARVQPIIATLGTFLVYQGLTLEVLPTAGGVAPPWMHILVGGFLGVPGVFYLLVAIGLLWLALGRTAYKRNLMAVGGELRAAYTAGVNVVGVRILAYVIAGLMSAVAGIVFTAVLNSADPTVGMPYTLSSVAAVVLGGVSLMGGRGGFLGAAAGGALLFLIQNLFTVAQVSVFYIQVAYGAILLVALALNAISDRLRRRTVSS
ncbi:MAG TPA: ABC transporter permease [Stellaceae bacterium]|jgi:ribose transport system permease protein|nr:ABC transporter permease [Stellaceae bacterium]